MGRAQRRLVDRGPATRAGPDGWEDLMIGRRALGLAAGVAMTLGLMACGGDDGGSGSTEAWCDVARDVEAASEALGGDDIDPTDKAAVKALFDDLEQAIDRAEGKAPAEIRADVDKTLAAFTKLIDVIADKDYDFLAAVSDPEVSSLFEDQSLTEAGDRISAYNERECGIPSGS